jgi:glycosyltransferase involved in cell wall biosynthesis
LKVSVICTVKNEVASIEPFLKSIIAQTMVPDELVIVDGGSTDGTVERIERTLGGKLPYRVIVKLGANIAAGRNAAVREASYDLIAVIDAGCRADPAWLEELTLPFREERPVDFVGGVTLSDPGSWFEGCVGRRTTAPLESYEEEGWFYSSRNVAFTREIWARVGGYPEWLYTAEDTLFNLELRRVGCRFTLAREARVWWHPRSSLRAIWRQWYLYRRGDGRIGYFASGTAGKMVKYLFAFCLLVVLVIVRIPLLWLAILLLGLLYSFLVTRLRATDLKTYLMELVIMRWRNLAEVVGQVHGTIEWLVVPRFRRHLREYRSAQPSVHSL